MAREPRSLCPINLSLELLGDHWSLVIVRDIMFADRRTFGELLQVEEGISSSVLSERLSRLVEAEVLIRSPDPRHRQRHLYSLTERGLDLLPVLIEIGAWGRRHLPVTDESAAQARRLEEGGATMRRRLERELRSTHIEAQIRRPPEGDRI